jgi:hypothetical protein
MEPPGPPCDPLVDLEAWVIHTRLAQGLPARVADPTVLTRIADLLCTDQLASRKGKPLAGLHRDQASCSFQEVSDSRHLGVRRHFMTEIADQASKARGVQGFGQPDCFHTMAGRDVQVGL